MKAPTNGFLTNAGEGERKSINSELWHACAGPLVSLPSVGSLVVYFAQGHSEQVAASMQKETDFIPNYPNLPSKLICMLHNLTLHADPETDEVYAQMTLQPVTKYDKDALLATDLGLKQGRQPAEFFCKTLTASDTSTHGGFSVPRRAAEKIFPPLDFSMQPPAQELVARDLHDNSWTFRHIYRGQPKRHLLTTGWSVFVSTKRLFAGDSVLFIRDEKSQLLLGTRRANRQQPALSSSVISSDSMHIGILAAAAHAAANNSPFTIFYNPRTSPSEFVISLAKYNKAMYTQISLGMRFRMMFETEDSGVRRYMGTVTGISDLDSVRWKNSQWRNLQVGWDESAAGERPSRVSIWEIDPVITPFYICPPPFFRPKFPKQSGIPDDESDMEKAFKRAMPWLGDDFGFKDTLPGLSLVQWMSMQQQQNNQFPSNQSGFSPSILSPLNNFNPDDPSKLLSFQGPPNLQYNNKPNQVNQLQPPQLLQNPINQQTQKLTEQQLSQPSQLNNAVVSSVNQPVMCSQLQQQQQQQQLAKIIPSHLISSPQDSSHFQQQIEQQPISLPMQQQQMQAQLLQQSLSQRMQRAPHQMLSEQQIQLQLLQRLQHQQQQHQQQHQQQQQLHSQQQQHQQQQQLLSQQQQHQQQQQLLSQAGPNFPPQLPHQQQMQANQQNQQLPHLAQQQQMNSNSFPAEKLVNNTNMCPTSGPIQTHQIPPVAQSQPLSQPQFKPLNAIRGHSGLTDGDAPSCSTSPSANNSLVSPPNFTNRNQQGSMSLAGDSFIEPSSNMLQELLQTSENRVKHDLVNQKGQDQLKYKGPISDPLEASSSGTSYCLDASTIHQTFPLPTFCLDTNDVQSHPRNNLPFAAGNLDGFNNPDNTLLSRGYDSQKDLQNLLSNYGGTARDIETELSTADISPQSLGVPQNMSFKPSCSNDVTINETAVLNGGMWTNQSQRMRTYTKVQKRGSVGRCIDITRYKGYDELRNDLARMFGIEGQLENPLRTEWKLVYVDHENDILLVGDDPWEDFVSCVQSIKILSLAEVQRMSLDGYLGHIQQVSNQACSGTDSGNAWRGQFDDNSAASFNR